MDPNLRRAEAELAKADDTASRVVETQLHSIEDGIFEESEGDSTQDDPGPKVDRIAELHAKLEAIEDEAEGETREHVAAAREHVRTYLRDHPHGK